MNNPTFPNLTHEEVEKLTFETLKHLTLRGNSNSLVGRKCEIRGCNAKLTYEINFRNVFCWNCLFKLALERGNNERAEWIAENYL